MKAALVTAALTLVIAGSAEANGLFVYGDSFAVGTKPFLPGFLPHWNVRQDVDHARDTSSAPSVLREVRLPAVVHISLGTMDDRDRPERFLRQVHRVMRTIGPERCVVWANIFRPRTADSDRNIWGPLNRVLAQEAARRDNLLIVDWASMLERHPGWKVDGAHVNERGYRARAKIVARTVRDCYSTLAAGAGGD